MGSRFFGSLDIMRGFAKTGVPLGVPGVPSGSASAVLFLVSPAASFIVGHALTVAGLVASRDHPKRTRVSAVARVHGDAGRALGIEPDMRGASHR